MSTDDVVKADRAFNIRTMAQGVVAHYGVEAILMATRQVELCAAGSATAETWKEILAVLREPTVRLV